MVLVLLDLKIVLAEEDRRRAMQMLSKVSKKFFELRLKLDCFFPELEVFRVREGESCMNLTIVPVFQSRGTSVGPVTSDVFLSCPVRGEEKGLEGRREGDREDEVRNEDDVVRVIRVKDDDLRDE